MGIPQFKKFKGKKYLDWIEAEAKKRGVEPKKVLSESIYVSNIAQKKIKTKAKTGQFNSKFWGK